MSDDGRYVFSAICPKCGEERPQEYRRQELRYLLAESAKVKAYCIKCDEHWNLSEEERDRLAHNFMLE